MWYRHTVDGWVIQISVHPGTKQSGIVGVRGEWLKINVSAPPEKGKANEEVVALLAETFGVPKRNVQVVSGQRSRKKKVLVTGVTEKQVVDI